MNDVTIVSIVLAILAVVFASATIKVVSQGSAKVIERLGRFHKLAKGGLNIIVPFIDGVRATIDLREQISDVEPQPVITKDNVTMNVDCVIYWQVLDPIKSTYEISDIRRALDQLALAALRNVIGSLDLDHTLTSRDTINGHMRNVMDQATDRWGVKITRVELKNIEPPIEVKLTMEKQMTAERTRRAVVTEAEGSKSSAILRAEGEKQAAIVAAEGRREANVLDADGQAQAVMRLAQAEATAIATIAKAFGDNGDPGAYLIAQKYLETLRDIGRSPQKTVFLPYEASAVMGSLGSVKKMLGELEGSAATPAPPPRR